MVYFCPKYQVDFGDRVLNVTLKLTQQVSEGSIGIIRKEARIQEEQRPFGVAFYCPRKS